MDERSKPTELKKVPMRKLMASVKSDIRKTMRDPAKPRKSKKS